MISTLIKHQARPFLKWAGGKGQLLVQMESYLPKELTTGKIKKYFEPFLGGGSVFFWLAGKYEFQKAYLYEINQEIGVGYKVIQSNVNKLVKELKDLESAYLSKSAKARESYYYQNRSEYNSCPIDKIAHQIRKTALLIFLNKTGYNGLYRVNSHGNFNVPSGRYKNPTICDEDNLLAVSEALQIAEISWGDFSGCLKYADASSFVYFDPPYRPISQTSSFTSYSRNTFDDKEQTRLKTVIDALDKKGSLVMLSNSDPRNYDPRDNFFDNLYRNYRIRRLKATRMINCQAEKRGSITEILVMNYQR